MDILVVRPTPLSEMANKDERMCRAISGSKSLFTPKTNFIEKGDRAMQEIVAQVANVGFPIVVSIYLLVRVEAKMESLTNSINELAKVISRFEVRS